MGLGLSHGDVPAVRTCAALSQCFQLFLLRQHRFEITLKLLKSITYTCVTLKGDFKLFGLDLFLIQYLILLLH